MQVCMQLTPISLLFSLQGYTLVQELCSAYSVLPIEFDLCPMKVSGYMMLVLCFVRLCESCQEPTLQASTHMEEDSMVSPLYLGRLPAFPVQHLFF